MEWDSSHSKYCCCSLVLVFGVFRVSSIRVGIWATAYTTGLIEDLNKQEAMDSFQLTMSFPLSITPFCIYRLGKRFIAHLCVCASLCPSPLSLKIRMPRTIHCKLASPQQLLLQAKLFLESLDDFQSEWLSSTELMMMMKANNGKKISGIILR